ncbi:MAG: T9SS type A sorting domain-containing protein [candidate division Zixibacteria bacterium]|nr:T9SS type A sorting domain-containing protein [candidate division Zixibacteria bacterium]
MKKMLIGFLAVMLSAIPALADDPGIPDTIAYQQRVYIPYNPGSGMIGYLSVYLVTDDSVADITIPTTWRSTDGLIYADSVIWDNFFLQWDDCWSRINRDTSIIHILGFYDLGGEDNPPLFTNLQRITAFTIRFRIDPMAEPQIVTVDTTYDRRMGSANFGRLDGSDSFTPIVVPGSLYYGIQADIGESGRQLPTEFVLEQNYPNPFNPVTQISFELPSAGLITIEVYNILGQSIKTLISEYKNAGRYSIIWDGTNEAGQAVLSGVYFYRLTTKEQSITKRMMLLK